MAPKAVAKPKAKGVAKAQAKSKGPHVFDSKHALRLVKKWSWGLKSGIQLREEAQDAYDDQLAVLNNVGASREFAQKSLKRLAGLGSSGRHPSNIKDQLVTMLGEPTTTRATCYNIPMKILKPGPGIPNVQDVPVPIFEPHAQASDIYHHNRPRFNKMFLGGCDDGSKLKSFWNAVEKSEDPRLTNHPMKSRDGWKEKAIPTMIHDDAVPCVNVGKPGTKSWDCISFQGLLSIGSTLFVKLYIAGMFSSNKAPGTDHELWSIIVWSLWFAFLGTRPTISYDRQSEPENGGEPLCGGFFFVPWIVKADLDALAKCFGFRHYSAGIPCELCECTSEQNDWPNNYANFTARANWKKTLHTILTWRLGELLHPLFHLIFFSCHNIEPDELHIIHQGTSTYMYGSILWKLVYQILPGDASENMALIWGHIVERYRQLGTDAQYSNLDLSSFCDPASPQATYPRLKGSGCEVKDLLLPLQYVWAKYMDDELREHHLIKEMLSHQADIQSILSDFATEPVLPPQVSKDFQLATDLLLKKYVIVAQAADAREELLFSIVPKHHWMWHLAHRSQYLNPRRGNTMVDEDFVGHVKTLVQACVHGTKPHMVPIKVAEKMVWALYILSVYGE